MFGKFWQHHYFDWIQFARRSAVVGVGGGLVLGTLLFGDMSLSLRRIKGKYTYYLQGAPEDVRANVNNWHTKLG